ncbi:translation elongation factor 4 [Fusobacterium pseudoperiodonticum]|jgi:GTP-binding protein lepA|uniref:Elongation factor 4 n=2 Tax=Fusobacterium periodonticum TaxID=860 RepID=A0AAD0HUU1_9FUSO|nr:MULTISPECIES: translation elongation factor 4 [Fusobacterium]AVQ25404.1 elongation factor 4 [Fusobacterium periodonticum]KGE63818.1 elongation factor 4 [Fusobacterium periodonticum 2_1_31]MBF1191956.1 elongation factor 4 [Fusobacterium periodonticum]MBF1195283.1 elongation factor 4 [Fusobacterium periodonticum]MBF1206687.1 elongation factor 4 [Fusobacterium periodonticum]
MLQKNKRNFSIIAHIDHGKSTIADRLLEYTGTVSERDMKDQILDSMDLEREKGITIKAQAVTLFYKAKDGEEYELNLIDTPGHVDFIYEVSRSLAACEGALLVVDAAQGVEAQTLANVYLAIENNLEILPIINKIDLPAAEPEKVKREIEDIIGLPADDAVLASAKNGIGIENILEAIVQRIPAPNYDENAPLKALIFDSFFDDYRGVITYIKVLDGSIKKGDKIKIWSTEKELEVLEAGIFSPTMKSTDILTSGSVGYIITGVKTIHDTRVGDTITTVKNPALFPLAGFKPAQSMVFAGVYPLFTDDYEELREALEKLQLNDASLTFVPETSIALGFGFRCGFLGLLHMEIIVERLRREYNIDLISTTPSVEYKVRIDNQEERIIDNPCEFPEPGRGKITIQEPYIRGKVIVPKEYVGNVMELCQEKRGIFLSMDYLDETRSMLSYELPLAEIVIDFYDKLKSRTKGYASFEYELSEYRESNLVKVDILVSGKPVDAFSFIAHNDNAFYRGKAICQKLSEVIPRQQFEIPIQAALGSKIIARETIKAYRKNVIAKCYGGDITRKKKLLEKQKEGKKRMKSIGNVEIPQEAFVSVLKLND